METIKEIVKGTTAELSHFCNGKGYYFIRTKDHIYQLTLNSLSSDWKNTYLLPEFKAIRLMRWIRKGMQSEDDSFIQLK